MALSIECHNSSMRKVRQHMQCSFMSWMTFFSLPHSSSLLPPPPLPSLPFHLSPDLLFPVHKILQRAGGIYVRGKTLPQVSIIIYIYYVEVRFKTNNTFSLPLLLPVSLCPPPPHIQVPTVYESSGHEIQFARKVEEVLSPITIPEYRQIVVEVSE